LLINGDLIKDIFPEFITKLPKINIPIQGCTAYLFQGEKQQIVFMRFDKDAIVPEHSHGCQWEIVLDGKADVYLNDEKKQYCKGDRFYVPADTPHKARIYAGYTAIAIFDQPDRYKI